jgi:hypothetical protein
MSKTINAVGEAQAPRHAVERSSGGTQPKSVPDMTRAMEIPRDRYGRWLAACGILGPLLLTLYFGVPALVPRLGSLSYSSGTPATAKIVTVGANYHLLLSIGCWMQGTGALLSVVFLLALAQWAGAGSTLPGRILLLACAALVGLVLVEMVFTLTWASAATHGQPSTARVAYDLMARFVQVFPIVPAPAVYLALAAVLATGRPVLPAVFTRLATVIGTGFLIIGTAVVLTPTAAAVAGGLAALQGLWILAAGITAYRFANVTPG